MAVSWRAGLWSWVPNEIARTLDPALGPVLEPIRSEVFGRDRFEQHARSLAATHRAGKASFRQSTFYPRLQDNIRSLKASYQHIAAQTDDPDPGPAAAWLLDNFHLIEGQLQEIRRGLPGRYYRSLPVLQEQPLVGLPRIYGVAWAFVAHTDSEFDETLLHHILEAYQGVRELSLGELWALPTTLRVVLVENLRRLADRVVSHKAARELASLCAQRIGRFTPTLAAELLAVMVQRGVDGVFLAHLSQSLLAARPSPPHHTNLADMRAWLQEAVPDLVALQVQLHATQAADQMSLGNAVTALRKIGTADWAATVARCSRSTQVMLGSPVFEAEDDDTRTTTLHGIERLASLSGRSESEVARALLHAMASGTGHASLSAHWLSGGGAAALRQTIGLKPGVAGRWRPDGVTTATVLYLGGVLGASVLLVAWLLGLPNDGPPRSLALTLLAAGLMWWPACETVVALVNRLVGESVKPAHLPRLLLAGGIPPAAQVIVVVPALLTSPAGIATLVHRLHLHHLANPEGCAQFALLSDWADAPSAHTPDDEGLLSAARAALEALNRSHPVPAGQPARFLLLHRPRSWCETQGQWLGWERKRGKLEQLVAALATGDGSAFFALGALSTLAPQTRYVLTLDSDTRLPPGCLRTLVGVAEHPQHQPELSEDGRRVVRGYGIFQPRLVAPLPDAGTLSGWQWLGGGQRGLDPYSAVTSDVYQDLFREGSFTGKGLLHVATLHAVLGQRLPPERVLSHDLIEGALVRCAVVSDVSLIEAEPEHADAAAARLHRWIRGDWQLWPFLTAPRAWPLGAMNRWKLADNLRRSLVAPASLALIVLSMAHAGLSLPVALLLAAAAQAAGPLMGALAGGMPRHWHHVGQRFIVNVARDLLRTAGGALWHLAMLLRQALRSVDAIARTVHRLTVSQRHLLEWTTAEAAQAGLGTGLRATLRRHRAEPLAALVLLLGLWWVQPRTDALTLAVIAMWAATPLWIWLMHLCWPTGARRALPRAEQAYLAGVARDTWRLFERCVDAQNHHLPPDNLQTAPFDTVAHRTSPTNIGLYLLSALCARRFGWIGTEGLLVRLDATLTTLHQMERHRGHFLNWYDTETLQPLPPRYVSTVDSGNFSAHLLTVAQACLELAAEPHAPRPAQAAIAASRQRLAPWLGRFESLLHQPLHTLALGQLWPQHAAEPGAAPTRALLQQAGAELDSLAAPRHAGVATPPIGARDQLLWLLRDHLAAHHHAELDRAALRAGQGELAARRLRAAARALQALAWAADFRFLYHPRRHLLHIGYNVDAQRLDTSMYDLLASESRTTSLLAIAKGDVPARHWAALGRPFFASGWHAALSSWSGSMFEYLMPTLVADEPQGSALREAGRSALREQRAFVRGQSMPWGMSESAYAGRDNTLAYQYAPQGVPRLALRRTPEAERVIAPYATALAAGMDPRLACENLRALEALGARGHYGLVEAIDFTAARQVDGVSHTLVHTFMAHHQGMTIASLTNVLHGGLVQRWGMADARMQAVACLLHEQAPRQLPRLSDSRRRGPAPLLREPNPVRVLTPGAQALEPTHLLSNGRYSVTLRANGAGWSRWAQTGISRWRDDALRDAHGSFLYVRTERAGAPSSITSHPAPDPAATYQCRFHNDRVCFDAAWPELNAHTTVWVSPEDDIELRKVVLNNLGSEVIELELISAMDITLASAAADESHPAFSNLFVKADWLPDKQALRFERTPRLASEAGAHAARFAAHFVASSQGEVHGLRCQVDRLHWLGRNHTASQPLATLHPVPMEATALDTGLDPVAALGVSIRLAPGAQASVTFATTASDSAATLLAVIDKYREPSHVERASALSATLAGIPSGSHRPRSDYLPALHAMTTALVLTLPRLDEPSTGAPPASNRRALWPLGISGDRPIVLVHAGVAQGLGLLRLLANLLREWSRAGVACDLVVLSQEAHSYDMPLQRELALLQEQHTSEQGHRAGAPMTGLHLLRTDALAPEQLDTLEHLARVSLQADGQPLLHQIRDWCARHERTGEDAELARRADPLPPHLAITAATPVRGAFVREGAGFAFHADRDRRPPRPWINVLANPGFGALVSEGGGGHTWALNSRLHQLTAWSNDPVADPPGEWFWLQDRRTREAWSLFPSAWGGVNADYRIEHGQGHTTIEHRHGAVAVSIRWCVDADSAVKQVRIVLTNEGQRKEHLRLTGMVEWVLGERRGDRATLHTSHAFTEAPASTLLGLLCTQTEQGSGFGGSTAFFCEGESGMAHHSEGLDWGCDRRAFFDPEGRPVLPRELGQRSGTGLDPCAALSRALTLRPGATLEQVYLIGHAASADAARALMQQAIAVPADTREQATRARWATLLGTTQVSTPDPLLDALTNHWLLYQTVSSRLWAKAAFYQAGGATGFRDQLQDAMALAWAEPGWLRAQLVLCASRQFEAGDVQHWWHMPGGAGVRTHMSDDLLWLPFACSHYLRATGDAAVLDEPVPFLDAPPVPAGEEDTYSAPATSALSAPLYEHAARAIDHSLRVGRHGLPLMGGGDWNDGMNRVGHGGQGESVWLGWFLCAIVPDWIALAQQRGEAARAQGWADALAGWQAALQGPAWDGAWFRRAFFDDGSVLGSSTQSEARIDLIAQAWSVLSGQAAPEHQAAAMHAVEAQLVDPEAGLIRLLTPPLAHAQPSAGYIQAYPAGVRENGGQYAHAGVWALMASAMLARRGAGGAADAHDTPYRYFTYLSPAHRAAHPQRGAAYGLEPYAMAADVYSESPRVGRGGWSWYTGAAGWMHRAVVESLLGLHQEADELFFTPCLPAHWPRASITLVRGDTRLRFTVLRASAADAQAAEPFARCLAVGERLHWRGLPPGSQFVIPLQAT